MNESERLSKVREWARIPSWRAFAANVGACPQTFFDINAGRHGISYALAQKINTTYPEVNAAWLVTGEGEMFAINEMNGIPLYNGGTATAKTLAENSGKSVDAGSLFKNATMAFINATPNMVEYPKEAVVIVREITDRNLLRYGQHYLVATDEYVMVRRLQQANNKGGYVLYATDMSTYPDGHLIHEPINLPVDSVKRIFAVMGYIVPPAGTI